MLPPSTTTLPSSDTRHPPTQLPPHTHTPRHAQVIAGVAADGRAVVSRAQGEAANYKSFYGDAIPGHVLAERVASFVHVFNLYWYVR